MVCEHNRILRVKRKKIIDTHKMDESQKWYIEEKKLDKKDIICTIPFI